MKKQTKIGLSLSGGGARAIAHIGVIQALREEKIHINHIVATGSGAIIGVLYAAGLSTEKMLAFVKEENLFKNFQASIPFKGIQYLDSLKKILEQYTVSTSIEQLQIPVSIAVINLKSGELEFLDKGDLSEVLMAACSIPLLFQAVPISQQDYVDGGMLDNMPIKPLQEVCDIILGVNIAPKSTISVGNIDSLYATALRLFDITISENAAKNKAVCDFVIEPKEVLNYSLIKIEAIAELYEIGYNQAKAQMNDILGLIQKKSSL